MTGLRDYQISGGLYATATLRHLARQAKSDAYLGTNFERALTEAERKALRKVSRLAAEAARALEGAS